MNPQVSIVMGSDSDLPIMKEAGLMLKSFGVEVEVSVVSAHRTPDRLVEFLEKYITTKFKNKLIILDNASSHRNERIKELVNKYNNILYAVPYQHFTNSIENFFSMLKSRLQKLNGLTHEKLKENIEKVIKDIPKEKYENIFKGAYNRTEKYVKKPSNRTRKLKNYLP